MFSTNLNIPINRMTEIVELSRHNPNLVFAKEKIFVSILGNLTRKIKFLNNSI